MRLTTLLTTLLALTHFGGFGQALAEPISFSLEIDDLFTMAPGSTLLIPAIITNTCTEGVTFVPAGDFEPDGFLAVVGASSGTTFPVPNSSTDPIFSNYTFSYSADGSTSSIPFTSQFDGLVLDPGESFAFIAARIDILDGFPAGEDIDGIDYTMSIRVGSDGGFFNVFSNTETFRIEVVPEPATVALLGLGLAAQIVLARRRKRRQR